MKRREKNDSVTKGAHKEERRTIASPRAHIKRREKNDSVTKGAHKEAREERQRHKGRT